MYIKLENIINQNITFHDEAVKANAYYIHEPEPKCFDHERNKGIVKSLFLYGLFEQKYRSRAI